jgi:hypothetical protein
MGAKPLIQEHPAFGQGEVFEKYQSALKLLCCRVLGEPYNFRAIDEGLTAEMCGGDYFGRILMEAQRQFRQEGRYSCVSIEMTTGFSSGDMMKWAQADAEIDLPAAWSMFGGVYGQWVELQIADAVRSWITQGQGSEEIRLSADKFRREKGVAAKVVGDDGKQEFERELINAIECKPTNYPVRPPMRILREAIPFFEPGEYVVVAGRTGMGKSYFAMNALYQCATDAVPCSYYNLENTPKNVQRRLWQMHTGIKWQRQYPGAPDDQIRKMMDGWAWVRDRARIQTRTPGRTLHAVLNTIRTDFYEHGIQLAVVDYLQKITESSFKGTRVDQLAEISAELRQLASDLKIPVIALAQVNREAERSGSNKRPAISDIRGSGDIEQDASTILLLYRPDYYELKVDENGDPYPPEYADVFIGKGRDTEQMKIKCRFNEVLGFHDAPAPFDFPSPSTQFPVHRTEVPEFKPSAVPANRNEDDLPF